MNEHPIGVFDSGYGGLSILQALQKRMPTQPFLYLGDHKNAPYGSQSKETLYQLTKHNIDWLFKQNCNLVILACNTASSVLRRLQHEWLPRYYPDNRVLGIVVPTIEKITGVAWNFPVTNSSATSTTVAVFATEATVRSQVYPLEIHKRAPQIRVVQQACPSLVSLIEENAPTEEIAKIVSGYVEQLRGQLGGNLPDYALLGCTHYALIEQLFREALTPAVQLVSQPDCVASSFENYLQRHPHFKSDITALASHYFTSGHADKINKNGLNFLPPYAQFTSIQI